MWWYPHSLIYHTLLGCLGADAHPVEAPQHLGTELATAATLHILRRAYHPVACTGMHAPAEHPVGALEWNWCAMASPALLTAPAWPWSASVTVHTRCLPGKISRRRVLHGPGDRPAHRVWPRRQAGTPHVVQHRLRCLIFVQGFHGQRATPCQANCQAGAAVCGSSRLKGR